MSFDTTTGAYTAVSGAETATAGQVIASATWNAINTDYDDTFNIIGPWIVSLNTLTIPVRDVSLGTASVDTAVNINTSLFPRGASNYAVQNMILANAVGTPTSATIGLYTAASAGGTAIVTSTAITITTSIPGSNNSMQFMTINDSVTMMFNKSTLYIHVGTVTASATIDVLLEVRPL